MNSPTVSVAIASRGRPDALMTCLSAVARLCRATFEIVVVADREGMARLENSALAARVKSVRCDIANISLARNLALERAAGDVVAFLDDDSTPEPAWLFHLIRPFRDPSVMAATGFVLGRNGISFQTRAQMIDSCGFARDIPFADTAPALMPPPADGAVSTIGTNCAFRTQALRSIGGFDPAFRYFLDETDVNMRLARLGAVTAVVPLAQVHHRSLGSHLRTGDRVPLSLFEIGRSRAIFLRRHAPEAAWKTALERERAQQHRRLFRHATAGRLAAEDIAPLLTTLQEGMDSGQRAHPAPVSPMRGAVAPFLAFRRSDEAVSHRMIVGPARKASQLRRRAREAAAESPVVSLFVFSNSARPHRVRYRRDGYWEQTGGVWGRSRRDGPLFRPGTLARRAMREQDRIAPVRFPWDN